MKTTLTAPPSATSSGRVWQGRGGGAGEDWEGRGAQELLGDLHALAAGRCGFFEEKEKEEEEETSSRWSGSHCSAAAPCSSGACGPQFRPRGSSGRNSRLHVRYCRKLERIPSFSHAPLVSGSHLGVCPPEVFRKIGFSGRRLLRYFLRAPGIQQSGVQEKWKTWEMTLVFCLRLPCIWQSLVQCFSRSVEKYRNLDISGRFLPELLPHTAPMLGTTVDTSLCSLRRLGTFTRVPHEG